MRSLSGASLAETIKGQAPLDKNEAQAAMQRIDESRDQAQCAQAITLWQQGRSNEARQLLDQVLARHPDKPLARRLLADLELECGEVEKAERLLVELIEQHPEDQAARASLAWLYQSQGRDQQAKEIFQQLDGLFSPSP